MEAEQTPEVAEVQAPDPIARTPEKGSMDYAVSQLLKEPAKETPEVEPEAQLEETEEEVVESEDEVEDDESETQTKLEEEEEESESPEGEQESELVYTVKIDGDDYEVTADELKSGYQRQKDYTKKTQALAEQRKEYEAKLGEMNAQQESFMQQATMANELLNRDLKKFANVDWDALKVEDPVGYVQKQIEVQDIRSSQAELRSEIQKVYEHNQKVMLEENSKALELERKTALEHFPDWKDSKKATAHQTKIADYARSVGYTDEELSLVQKAKDLLVLDKARKYDELESSKKDLTKKVKPTMRKLVKPKGAPAKGSAKRKERAEGRDRLRKSGSLRDAAALMYEMQNSKVINKPK